MVVSMSTGRPPCPGELLVTPADKVLCQLNADHIQHAYPGGADNPEPSYHQGAWGGRIYVWSERDAGTIRTLRDAGFHAQCDRHAVKLAVVVAP